MMTESPFINEFIELGEMRGVRESLIDVIQGRFPEVLDADVPRAIADQPSLPLLRTWHSAAVRARTSEDFLKVLRQ